MNKKLKDTEEMSVDELELAVKDGIEEMRHGKDYIAGHRQVRYAVAELARRARLYEESQKSDKPFVPTNVNGTPRSADWQGYPLSEFPLPDAEYTRTAAKARKKVEK